MLKQSTSCGIAGSCGDTAFFFPMAESPLLVLLLALIGVCTVIMTVTVLTTVSDLRRMIRQINAILPRCDQAVQEAQHCLGQARLLLRRANKTAQQVEQVFQRTCHAAAKALDQWVLFQGKARSFLTGRWGNGARVVSRRHV